MSRPIDRLWRHRLEHGYWKEDRAQLEEVVELISWSNEQKGSAASGRILGRFHGTPSCNTRVNEEPVHAISSLWCLARSMQQFEMSKGMHSMRHKSLKEFAATVDATTSRK